ncbi:protein TASOR isoform X4 [Monodelphis domestica]|uniref:protein TASOR isoform X4 n=1 Tax=Monodelphis domestica TaxID=13616 RepID=UPI0024E2017F|nr:protein TASOR isoform X4 [Monodelphis domestica]
MEAAEAVAGAEAASPTGGPAAPEPEAASQNGGGGGGGDAAAAGRARARGLGLSLGLGLGRVLGSEPEAGGGAATAAAAVTAALARGPDELPVRRNFQIPRKSREKKALFQPVTTGTREFEDILKVLHTSYLEPGSVANFNYRRASLVHNELLEKEFTEKRRELRFDGRSDKELAESYAFLMVDRPQVQGICEKGLQVGQSKIQILGSPSMGIYLSRYADLLQANPLEAGATGDVIIFKIIKGKMKSIYDPMGVKNTDSTVNKSSLDPTPKHECHVSKNANRITSLLAYRAFELTQYYFYEYGFDELRRRPRHVCPYAVVSFAYKDDVPAPKFLTTSRSNSFNVERTTDKTDYTLWKGELLNKGKLLCCAYLKSATLPFLPFKLPEKLDVETVMSIDHLKQKIPPALFYKETYLGAKEVLKNGMYCSLYEVIEKTRTGSNLESLIQRLEREKLVLVKPLGDRGYLFLLSPWQMASPYEHQTAKTRVLHALFLFQEPRGVVSSQKALPKVVTQERPETTLESIPGITKLITSIHYALVQCRKDLNYINTTTFSTAIEKHINEYFKRAFRSGRRKEFIIYPYDSRLDDKKFLYSAPKNKSHVDSSLHNYIFQSETYQLPICKVKELMEENRKVTQFSPVSDSEGPEEETDFSKLKLRKRNSSKSDILTVGKKWKPANCWDYDPDRLKELINLIQCKKKNVGGDSDTEDTRNTNSLKRKHASHPGNMRKHRKTSDSSENSQLCEGSPPSVFSVVSGFSGQDTDLRQQENSDPGITDTRALIKLLLETLTNSSNLDPTLAHSVNQALGCNEETREDLRPKHDYELISAQNKEEYEQPGCTKLENMNCKDPKSPVVLEADVSSLKYPLDVDPRVSSSEVASEPKLHLKEDPKSSSVSTFDNYNLVTITPIEHCNRKQQSNSNNAVEGGMHWKLIPITDTLKGTREDGMVTSQGMKMEDQCLLARESPLVATHTLSATTESTMLEEYNLFSKKIEEILKQKNISYVSRISTPSFSAQEKMTRLSAYVCSEASQVSVQEFVNGLHEKLNIIIAKTLSCGRHSPPISPSPEDRSTKIGLTLPTSQVIQVSSSDFSTELGAESHHRRVQRETDSHEQPSSTTLGLAEVELDQAHRVPELTRTPDHTFSSEGALEPVEKENSRTPSELNISTQPSLSNFISQLEPEVFNSLVKIMKDVQKNTVKFYIHEEEESMLCKEIKEYLIKLGNTECHPEQFLGKRSAFDKLLIIIQNEEIAGFIHKVPGLVSLKKLSCVSFAGVDSLDDVKNHTYNELFVSGGFIVSDESVLNPEAVIVEKLKRFLAFLEELNTPDGKWQWKIHCKIQKKLKEVGRLSAKALNVLTLLNVYQKKHLVEILSYHNCDSQTRNVPELDCLIRLQAQNVQQRHVVFLTEKNVRTLSSYTDNGIVVASVEDFMQNFHSLVGFHNAVTEEKLLHHTAGDHLDGQSALLASDEKDEEDMSLDSGDETSQIEVCSSSHSETLDIETKGSRGPDPKESAQTQAQPSPDGPGSLSEDWTARETRAPEAPPGVPATAAASARETDKSVEQTPFGGFRAYPGRQLSMSHQFSHFSVLTHQTFLGTPYTISTSQTQEGGNYFLSAYTRSLETDKSSSPVSWDVNDSSRPYSKKK